MALVAGHHEINVTGIEPSQHVMRRIRREGPLQVQLAVGAVSNNAGKIEPSKVTAGSFAMTCPRPAPLLRLSHPPVIPVTLTVPVPPALQCTVTHHRSTDDRS
jgi:hypothetical protein